MKVDSNGCDWAELKELYPIDSLSESSFMISDVSLHNFAWVCMGVYGYFPWHKVYLSIGEGLFIDSLVSIFRCKDAEDRTMLLPKDLIKKREDIFNTLISASNNGEFDKICEEIMNGTPTRAAENDYDILLATMIIIAEWLHRQHKKDPSFIIPYGYEIKEFRKINNIKNEGIRCFLLAEIKGAPDFFGDFVCACVNKLYPRSASATSNSVSYFSDIYRFFEYFAWLCVGEDPRKIACKYKGGECSVMRLSSSCIEEHRNIYHLLTQAADSEPEFPIIKGQHDCADPRSLINWLYNKRVENPNFYIPFPEWMEKYTEGVKKDFEGDEKMHFNEERSWIFMYAGRLMKDMEIKGQSDFIKALNEQEDKIKNEMGEDLCVGKKGKGGDKDTIDKCFEKMRDTVNSNLIDKKSKKS